MPIMEMVYYQDMLIFDYRQKYVFLVQVDMGTGFVTTICRHLSKRRGIG